jgi:hypothetical protein
MLKRAMERIVWLVLVVFYAASVWRLYVDGWGRPDVSARSAQTRHAIRLVAGGRTGGLGRPAPAPHETEERMRSWS